MRNLPPQGALRVRQRTDWTTLLIHWGLVVALVASLSTGWRIAGMASGNAVLHWLDALLLQGNVLRWHFVSATVLVALVAGYLAFLWRAGVAGRLRVNLASLRSADRGTRWNTINRLIYWCALALLAGAAVTGVLLYTAPSGLPIDPLSTLHQGLSYGFVAYVVAHVVAQIAMGGVRQLLKMLTPRLAYGMGAAAALATGLAGATVAYVADTSSLTRLALPRVTQARELPALDGIADDPAWQRAPEAVVHTSRGFNLQGGEVDVHLRALHDGDHAYFLFRWRDDTRSQKHIPLVKTDTGWKLVHNNYFGNDENDYYEDKFAVMLARSPVAGGDTVRLGNKPLADKPGPTNRLGLHVTGDGSLADVWHWKSVRSGATNQFDDNYFGPPMDVKPGTRYTGGYTTDPKTGGGFDANFEKVKDTDVVKVKFLPKDLAAQQRSMGRFDPDPKVGDDGIYSMQMNEVEPFSAQRDAQIPVGTVIPSVLVDEPFSGDRGDVTVHAQWKDGWWTLEAKRKLDTGSKYDQPITNGMYLWVAVFDHNQVRHTRHVRPVQLAVE